MLKSQDVVIVVTAMLTEKEWTYRELAGTLDMSPSSIHDGLTRAELCHLFDKKERRILRRNLLEFLVHGIRYVFPSPFTTVSRGLPTAYAAPPLREKIQQTSDFPPVWPYAEGTELGRAVEPLHSSVPRIAQNNESFYEILSLIDAIRAGRNREKSIAADLLRDRILSE